MRLVSECPQTTVCCVWRKFDGHKFIAHLRSRVREKLMRSFGPARIPGIRRRRDCQRGQIDRSFDAVVGMNKYYFTLNVRLRLRLRLQHDSVLHMRARTHTENW